MANNKLLQRVLPLIALALLSAGCSTSSPLFVPPSVQPAQRPALPAEGRQPKPPSICLPTCSAGVERLFESWGDSLMLPTPPAASASGTATPPSPEQAGAK